MCGKASCPTMLAIILLLTIAPASAFWYSEDKDAVTIEEKVCPPGHFRVGPHRDLRCRPCPAGTFLSKYNREHTCIPHRQCSRPNELYAFKGNSMVDATCICRFGTQRTYNCSAGFTYNCTPCPAGTRATLVTPLSQIFEPGDTKCCPPNHFAESLFGRSICLPFSNYSMSPGETSVYPPHWHSIGASFGDKYDVSDVPLDKTRSPLLLATILVIVLIAYHHRRP